MVLLGFCLVVLVLVYLWWFRGLLAYSWFVVCGYGVLICLVVCCVCFAFRPIFFAKAFSLPGVAISAFSALHRRDAYCVVVFLLKRTLTNKFFT